MSIVVSHICFFSFKRQPVEHNSCTQPLSKKVVSVQEGVSIGHHKNKFKHPLFPGGSVDFSVLFFILGSSDIYLVNHNLETFLFASYAKKSLLKSLLLKSAIILYCKIRRACF